MTSESEATAHAIELLACSTTLSITTLFMYIANVLPEVCCHSKPKRDRQKGVGWNLLEVLQWVTQECLLLSALDLEL